MKRQVKKYCLFLIITILFINGLSAQTDTLFWFAVPYGSVSHDPPQNANITLTATDTDDPTNIIITQPYNPVMDTIRVTIDPLVTLTWDTLFTSLSLLKIMDNTYVQNPIDPSPFISNSAIKIQADREITAYYEYHRTRKNPDIFSIKGTNGLGTDFWIAYQDRWDNRLLADASFSQIIVVATKANTIIQVDFQKDAYGMPAAAGPFTFTLTEPGMTLMFVPKAVGGDPSRVAADRLKGTHITSNEPIAITVGDCSVVKGGWDMVGDQLVPVENMFGKATIGYEYIVMRGELNNTNGNDKVYVLTTENNTNVDYQKKGEALVNLMTNVAAGFQDDIDLFAGGAADDDYVYIVADKPIVVWHVSGFGREVGGAIIPTIDGCTGSLDVTFMRSKDWTGANYNDFYLNIMTHVDALNDFEISFNGGAFASFLTAADFDDVGVGDFWVLKDASSLQNGFPVGVPIRIRNSTNVFHLGTLNGVVSGGGCAYGYFSDFNENRGAASIIESGSYIITACYGEEIEFEASGGLTYSWTPTIYLDDPTSSEPSAYLPIGVHTYEVNITRPCYPDTQLQVSAEIYENAEAFFTLDENIGCAPFSVEINNLTLNADTFLWDFENNRVYDRFENVITTFSHTYQNTTSTDSIYTLRLYAYDKQKDCPDIYTKNIRVFPEIDADFSADVTIGCNPLLVNFTDLSSSPTTDSYKWTFGDGESYVTSIAPADVSHEYSHFDITDTVDFEVQLVATSPYFCRDTLIDTISVYSYLEAEFTIDTAYGCSPLTVTFTNNSSGEDSIYLDYGDATSLNGATFVTVQHTYTNTGTTVLEFPVELEVFNDEGCLKIWRDTITVYPEFTADYTIDDPGNGSYAGCNSRNVVFTNATTSGTHTASIFLWTFGDGSNSSVVSPAHAYNNTTNTDKIYDFTFHAESQYGCYDDTTDQITIYKAFANYTLDTDEGCAPLDVNITNTSVGANITTWLWNYNDGVTDGNENPGTHLHTYNNATGATLTRDLRLTVTHSNGWCTSFKEVPIDVFSEIDVSYSTTPVVFPICDSVDVVFNSTINPVVAGTSYEWNFGDGTSASIADPTHNYRNQGNANAITYNVSVNVETPDGCSDVAIGTVEVNPKVRAFFTIDESEGCSPHNIAVTPTDYPGIDEYRWDFDGDAITDVTSATSSLQTFTFPRNTTGADVVYNVTLDVFDPSGTCSDTYIIPVTVYSETKADFDPQGSIDCNPYSVTFDNLSFINAVTYNWDFDDGTSSSDFKPIHEFANIGNIDKTYNVNLAVTSNRGCIHDTTAMVRVYRYVNADFDIDISEGCSPVTVHVENNSDGGTYYWFWDDDDLTLGTRDRQSSNDIEQFDVPYTNILTGTTDINNLTLIARNGTTGNCYDTLKRAITVHPTIDAQFTIIPASGEGCNTLTVDFTNTTLNGDTYNWSFGDGSSTTTASPTREYINTTTNDKSFTVRMNAESVNGCTDYAETVITVYSKVISDFSVETSEGCPPFNTTIDNTSIGNTANTYQWLIDNNPVGGSPADLSDFDHTYENLVTSTRDYEVKLIATNPHGCTSEHTDIVTVYEFVEASYSMDIDNGCTPLDIEFTDLSSVPASTKYTWDFGDGASSGLSDPLHTFYNSSRTSDLQRTIDLTVQSPNYCSDDTSMTIDIYHQPLSKFFIDNTSSCPPLVSTLVKESEGEDMFEWRFDDGNPNNTTDANLTYSWDNTDIDVIQTYNLELWVGTINNCKDSTNLDLNVFPKVNADYTIDNNTGCSPLENVQFTNASTSPATQFFWSFGDGSTTNLENPTHDFANIGLTDRVYNVFFRASSEYNCWDTITKQVTVYVQPEAEFYVDPILLTFPDNIVGIDNKTNSGPFDYLWEFGDLDASTSVDEEPSSFEYDHWGEKIIELTVTSQTNSVCNDYYADTITILPPEVNADFTTNIDGGCLNDGLEVQFTAAGSAYAENYNYSWEFGDGETGTGQYINHTFAEAGVYYVKMTATSNEGLGEDYEYKTIRVYSNPKASFEVSPKLAMLNIDLEARVEFFNLSECNDTSGCAYVWDFGDGSTAISRDVTHNYTELGVYDVSLLATTAHGCRDSLTLYKEVEIIGAGEIAFPNAFTPNGDGLNDTFRPVSQGVIKYELLVYNRWGELIFTTKDLSAGWDGKVGGEYAKPDVYVWKAQGKFTNGRSFELAGDITLIR